MFYSGRLRESIVDRDNKIQVDATEVFRISHQNKIQQSSFSKMRGFGILRALPAREALPWRGAGRSWSVLNAGVTLLTNTANKSALPVISFAANATHGVSSASARKWSNISIKNMCRTVHQDAVRQVATRESLGAAAEVDGAAAEANRRARVELAAAYRILEQLGLNEGVCNHLTLMAPARDGSGAEVMLVIPYGMHWSEVRFITC